METQQIQQEDQARQLVQNTISGQETIRWVGTPDPIHAIRKTWSASIFGLIFGGFIYYIFSNIIEINNRGPVYMQPSPSLKMATSLVLVVFIIVTLRFVFAPLWEYLIAKGKVYAITDQRALIIEQFPSDKQTSYYPNDIKYVQIRGKGTGDIIFDSQTKTVTDYENIPGSDRHRMVRRRVKVNIGFFSISLPSPASELLRQMKASVQPPEAKQKAAYSTVHPADRFRQ